MCGSCNIKDTIFLLTLGTFTAQNCWKGTENELSIWSIIHSKSFDSPLSVNGHACFRCGACVDTLCPLIPDVVSWLELEWLLVLKQVIEPEFVKKKVTTFSVLWLVFNRTLSIYLNMRTYLSYLRLITKHPPPCSNTCRAQPAGHPPSNPGHLNCVGHE